MRSRLCRGVERYEESETGREEEQKREESACCDIRVG